MTTFWEETPEPFSAALVFAAGARHESFTTVEVTHLVEHLVMGALPRSHLDCNATVDEDTTTFYATGSRAEVCDFLTRVCEALADVPLGALEREARVLEVEDGNAAHPAICWSAYKRSGLTGPGLLGTRGAGVRRVTPEAVRRYASERFVKSNAVLLLSAAPVDVRLPLPEGPKPGEEPWRPSSFPAPGLIVGEVPRPTLSFLLPRRVAGTVAANVLRERILDELRHERGLIYDVSGGGLRLSADTVLAVYTVDGKEEDHPEIIEALVEITRDLGTKGPTQPELDHDRAGLERDLRDPRATMDWLDRLAYRHLYGEPSTSREELLAEVAAVSVDDVRRAMDDALPTVHAGVPAALGRPLDGLPDLTGWEPAPPTAVTGRRFGRRPLALAPRDLAVTVGHAGIVLRAGRRSIGGPWEEVVGVGQAPDACEVVFRHGGSFPLMRRHLKGYDDLVALLQRHAGDRIYPSTEDEILA